MTAGQELGIKRFIVENPTPHAVGNTLRLQAKKPYRRVTGEWTDEDGKTLVTATCNPSTSAQNGNLNELVESFGETRRLVVTEITEPTSS